MSQRRGTRVLLLILFACLAGCQAPTTKLCADEHCLKPIARAETMTNYNGGGGHDRLSFRKGLQVNVYATRVTEKEKLFEIEVKGKRGWASSHQIRELGVVNNATVEVPIDNAPPSRTPSLGVTEPQPSMDPLAALMLSPPPDPAHISQLMHPTQTTLGPDFATASPHVEHRDPGLTPAGPNDLEPTPVLRVDVEKTVADGMQTKELELKGEKLWGDEDDDEETVVEHEIQEDSVETPNTTEKTADEADGPKTGSFPVTDEVVQGSGSVAKEAAPPVDGGAEEGRSPVDDVPLKATSTESVETEEEAGEDAVAEEDTLPSPSVPVPAVEPANTDATVHTSSLGLDSVSDDSESASASQVGHSAVVPSERRLPTPVAPPEETQSTSKSDVAASGVESAPAVDKGTTSDPDPPALLPASDSASSAPAVVPDMPTPRETEALAEKSSEPLPPFDDGPGNKPSEEIASTVAEQGIQESPNAQQENEGVSTKSGSNVLGNLEVTTEFAGRTGFAQVREAEERPSRNVELNSAEDPVKPEESWETESTASDQVSRSVEEDEDSSVMTENDRPESAVNREDREEQEGEGEKDGSSSSVPGIATAPPTPAPSPRFSYSTRAPLQARPDVETVDSTGGESENGGADFGFGGQPTPASAGTAETEEKEREKEEERLEPALAVEGGEGEMSGDADTSTSDVPPHVDSPDEPPPKTGGGGGAFDELSDAFRQLFENFLDAVLPAIEYANAALLPLWPHIHAVVPPKYLNQATVLSFIVALYAVFTSVLYFVVRFLLNNKRVEKELVVTANQVLNLVSLRDALKEENLNLSEELDTERHMHIQAGSRISKLETDLDVTKKSLRDVERRLQAETAEKEALQRELADTAETLETTQSLLNDSLLVKQGKFSEDDDALQVQFETLDRMLNDQTAKVASLKADLTHTREENAKLKEQYLEAERAALEKREELSTVRAEYDALLARSRERDDSLENLKLALGLEDEGPESGENPIVCSFRAILNGDGDVSTDLANLFDVGRAKRQIRELEKENEELQVKVTELEVLREHVVNKDSELERLREKEKELQFVETYYRKKEEELVLEISRLKQREDRFLSQEKEGKTMADYVQTLEDKVRLIESDKQSLDVRGKEKLIELEKELCDCKFRLQQTQRRLDGVMAENGEFRKRAGLMLPPHAKSSPSGSLGDGVDGGGLIPFAPDLVPPMLPPGMLPPLPPHLRGPGPRLPLPPGVPPLADRLPPLGDHGPRPDPGPGPMHHPFQMAPRPPFFVGPPMMGPPPPHLPPPPPAAMRSMSPPGRGGRTRENRSPSPGKWSDRSAPARGFYRSSMRRRSRSISPASRGSMRSAPYRGSVEYPEDRRSLGSNSGGGGAGRGSVPPLPPGPPHGARRPGPRGGGRYPESPSPPPPPPFYPDDRDGDRPRRDGRSPPAYV